jgi:hypothetical protein
MGAVPSEKRLENVISHGMCDACADSLSADIGIDMMSFLDGLDAPVLVVDETGSVLTANKQARALLKKELPKMEGYKGGDVFECANAKLPEGCGNTTHCSGCTLRNTIMDTHATSISHLKTPAYLNQGTPDDCREIELLISTEKLKEVVLLRIDKVEGKKQSE